MGAKECRGRVSLRGSKDRVLQVRKVDREQVLAPAELPPTSPSLPRPPSHPGTCLGSIFEAAVIFLLSASLLLGHWYETMAPYYVKSILTEISASRQDRRVLQKKQNHQNRISEQMGHATDF